MADATVKVEGQYDFSGIESGLARLEAKMDAFARAGQRGTSASAGADRAMQMLTRTLGGLGVALSSAAILRAAWDMTELSFQSERAMYALDAMSGGRAPEYIRAVGEATNYTMSQMNTAQITARVLAFGFADTEAEAANFIRTAAILGGTFQGLDATASAQSFAMLLTNLQPRRLDTFGLSIAAVRERQQEMMQATQGLSSQLAWQQAVMEMAGERAASLSGTLEDGAASVNRFQASWQDFKASFGGFLSEVILPVIEGINEYNEAQRETEAGNQDLMRTLALTSETYGEYRRAVANAIPATHPRQIGELTEMMEGAWQATADLREEYTLHGRILYERSRGLQAEADAMQESEAQTRELAAALAFDLEQGLDIASGSEIELRNRILETIAAVDQHRITADAAAAQLTELGATQQDVENGLGRYADAQREAEQAMRSAEQATRDLYQTQTNFIGMAEEMAGAFDYVGRTAIAYPPQIQAAHDSLSDGLREVRAELAGARTHLQAYGDGTGELRERIAELEVQELFHIERLRDVQAELDATGQAYTIASLSASDLRSQGEFVIQFLEQTGQSALLAGEGLMALQERYGLATAEQMQFQAMLLVLDEAQEEYGLNLQDQIGLLDDIALGRIGSAEALEREIRAIRDRRTALEEGRAMRGAIAETPFAAGLDYGDLEAAGGVIMDMTAELSTQASDASTLATAAPAAYIDASTAALEGVEPIQVWTSELGLQTQHLAAMPELATTAFQAIEEQAGRISAGDTGYSRLAQLMAAMRSDMTWMIDNAGRWYSAMAGAPAVAGSAAGARAAAEGAPHGEQFGGPVAGGVPVIVGEAGPEIFVPRESGVIIPNDAITSGGRAITETGGKQVLSISIPVLLDGRQVGRGAIQGTIDELRQRGVLETTIG